MIQKPLYRYTTIDAGQLCRLFREDDVYIPSSDDHTKPSDIMRFIDNALMSEVIYTLGRNPRAEAFIFAPNHNMTTFQAHFAVRKQNRDGGVVRRVAEAGKWMFDNTTCRSVIAHVRREHKATRSVLAQLGMKRRGTIEKSVLFNGELRDELIYQATVDDFNALWADEFGRVE